jgi:excisionase family DNA binding protein
VDHADGSAQDAREVLAAREAYKGMDINQPLTLTVEQTAKLLGIGRSTAYELVHSGDIPSLRLGRRIVVPRARIAEILSGCPQDRPHAQDLRALQTDDPQGRATFALYDSAAATP